MGMPQLSFKFFPVGNHILHAGEGVCMAVVMMGVCVCVCVCVGVGITSEVDI